MEVLAATASVAGILTLVGQTLQGIVTLRNFFQDCSSASKTIARFWRELNLLERTVREVELIAAKLENSYTTGLLVSLAIQLEDCSRDVGYWLQAAQKSHPRNVSGSKATFKIVLFALKKENLKDYYLEIAKHKSNINISLSAIGRTLDVAQLAASTSHQLKLDEVAVLTRNTERVTKNALKRLESNLDPALSDESSSHPGSITSRLSRIESLLSSDRRSSSQQRSGAERSPSVCYAEAFVSWSKHNRALIDCSVRIFPNALANYIRLVQVSETTRFHMNMLASWNAPEFYLRFSNKPLDYLEWVDAQLQILKGVEDEVKKARTVCWQEGYDLDEIDNTFKFSMLDLPRCMTQTDNGTLTEKHKDLIAVWPRADHRKKAKSWLTKQDQINAWLLQNLGASPDLMKLHQSFMFQGETLSDVEWARLVLKYWPLDEAAEAAEQRNPSTIGAVDSLGARHSARVLFEIGGRSIEGESSTDLSASSLQSWYTAPV